MKNSKKKLKQIQIRKSVISKFIALFIVLNLISVQAVITDDFVEKTLDKNLKIKTYSPSIIVDDFAEANKLNLTKRVVKTPPIEYLPHVNNKFEVHKYVITEELNPPLLISIESPFTTKNAPKEGSFINFVTLKEFTINNKTYPQGTIVKGRIETVSQNAVWGTPADLVIGNFSIDGMPINGEISKRGANRVLWVRPLSMAISIMGGAGIFLIFIRGGHAKIKPNEVFEIGCY